MAALRIENMAYSYQSAFHFISSWIARVQSAVKVITQVTKPTDTSQDAFVIYRFPLPPINPEPPRRPHLPQNSLPRRRRRQQHIGQGLHHPPRRLYPDDSHNSNVVIQPCCIESKIVIVRWHHSPCGNIHLATTRYRFSVGLRISPGASRSFWWRSLIGNHRGKTLRTLGNARMVA